MESEKQTSGADGTDEAIGTTDAATHGVDRDVLAGEDVTHGKESSGGSGDDESAEETGEDEEPYESIPWFPTPDLVPDGEWQEMWRHGGENALVTVLAKGEEPNPRHVIGICTMARCLVGLTPYDIQIGMDLPGLVHNARGVAVWRLTKLPRMNDFLTLFTGPLREAENEEPAEGKPRLPTFLRLPRWDICTMRRDKLELVGGALHGMPLELDYTKLGPVTF